MEVFLLHLCILLVGTTVFAYIGKFLLKLLKISHGANYLCSFYNLLTGVIGFTICTAIYYTQLKTVNTILLIGLIAILILYKSNIGFPNKKQFGSQVLFFENNKFLFIDLLVLLFLFSLSFFKSYNFIEGLISSNDGDVNFYSHVSQFIAFSGQENAFNGLNIVDTSYHGVLPYHYFDLWFNAGITNLLSLINYNVLILITYPLLQFIAYKGITQLILSITKASQIRFWYIQILALLLTFLSGVNYFVLFDFKILEGFVAFAENVFLRPKVIIVYLGLITFIDFTLKRNYFFALQFVCLIPLLYFPTAPAIMGGLGMFILLYFIFNKKKVFNILTRTQLLLLFSFYMLINILLGLFLILFKPANNDIYSTITFIELIQKYDSYYIIRSLLPLVKGYILIGLVYLPILLLAIFCVFINRALLKDAIKNIADPVNIFILFFYLLVTIAGSVIWTYMYYSLDSWQLFHNCVIVFTNLIVSLFIIKFFLTYNINLKFKSVIVTCIFLFLVLNIAITFNEYSQQSNSITDPGFLKSINKEFAILDGKTKTPIVGISIYPNSKFKHIYDYNLLVDRSGAYIRNIKNNVGFISLNVLDSVFSKKQVDSLGGMALQDVLYKKIYRTAPLLFYIKRNGIKDFSEARIDFIKRNKVSFIVSKVNFEIPFLKSLNVRKKIIDPKSQDIIYFLNY